MKAEPSTSSSLEANPSTVQHPRQNNVRVPLLLSWQAQYVYALYLKYRVEIGRRKDTKNKLQHRRVSLARTSCLPLVKGKRRENGCSGGWLGPDISRIMARNGQIIERLESTPTLCRETERARVRWKAKADADRHVDRPVTMLLVISSCSRVLFLYRYASEGLRNGNAYMDRHFLKYSSYEEYFKFRKYLKYVR